MKNEKKKHVKALKLKRINKGDGGVCMFYLEGLTFLTLRSFCRCEMVKNG